MGQRRKWKAESGKRKSDFLLSAFCHPLSPFSMPQSSLGQLLMTGVPGVELDAATAATFRRIQPGAFILFGRNIQNTVQLRKLIDDLRGQCEIEPIVTIDQEGG